MTDILRKNREREQIRRRRRIFAILMTLSLSTITVAFLYTRPLSDCNRMNLPQCLESSYPKLARLLSWYTQGDNVPQFRK